jgi:hypothetical protein
MSQAEGNLEDSTREQEIADPIFELRREHTEIVGPLLDRMIGLANLLDAGVDVDPGQVREGIDLWEDYLHGSHRERLAALEDPRPSSCAVAVQQAGENHERAAVRLSHLRTSLEAYSRNLPHARVMLALNLRSDVLVDRAWITFEEEHPFSCLSGKLSPAANERILRVFAHSRNENDALEEKVRQFIAGVVVNRPDALEIRCDIASCDSRIAVPWGAEADAGIRISLPGNGWALRARDAAVKGSLRSSRVAFFCPKHAAKA